MKFSVEVTNDVKKVIKRLTPKDQARALDALKAIADDPFLGKPLHGKRKGQYSWRVWPYRIIYRIEKNLLIVFVIEFGPRGGVY